MAAKHYLLVAAGKDKPGIVAAVTKILFLHGCNLEDSSMTRLASEFAMLVIFQTPSRFNSEKLEKDARTLQWKHGLFVQIKPLKSPELAKSVFRGRPHLISIHGADKPGIVHHVSEALAEAHVNITDVSTRRISSKSGSGYVLFLEVELPSTLNAKGLEHILTRVTGRLKLHVSVRPIETSPL